MRDVLQYYLFNKEKKPLYLDSNNHIQEADATTFLKPDGNPARLQFSPDGWKDTSGKYARNTKYWGLFRDMMSPMKFAGDGRRILKNEMWTHGVEATTYLGITKLDQVTLPYIQKKWHITEINYPKFKETETEFEVEALEGGLSKYLKAKEDIVYTIPVDEVSVELNGMEFDFSRTYGFLDNQEFPDGAGRYYAGVTELGREGNTLDIEFKDEQLAIQVVSPNENYLLRTNIEKEFRISGNIRGVAEQNCRIDFGVTVSNNLPSSGGLIRTNHPLIGVIGQPLVDNQIFSFDFDETITVPALYQLYTYLWHAPITDQNGMTAYRITGGELKIEYVYRYKTTTAPGLWLLTALRRIVEKMTDGLYTANSNWLSTKRDIVLTSGDALRGISGAVMKTSLKNYFKSLNSHYSIALYIKDDVLWIEPKASVHLNTTILNLGQVKDATISFAEDLVGNSVKVGGPKADYLDVNGKYEVNQGQIWSLPGTRNPQELDLSSDYRTDPLGIELLRINYEQKKTTDSDSDNDTFMLHVVDESQSFTTFAEFGTDFNIIQLTGQAARIGEFPIGSVFRITGSTSNDQNYVVNTAYVSGSNLWLFVGIASPVTTEASVEVTVNNDKVTLRRDIIPTAGVPHPETIFNVELSGKHGLVRNGPYLRSLLDFQDAENIRLTSYDKNVAMVSDIVENADVQVGALGNKLFLPYYFDFTTELPLNVWDILNLNPYGKVKFRWNNQDWYGWLWDGKVQPAENDSKQWKLLAAPNNLLIKFNS